VYWTGVEFVEPSEHVAAAIADFMETLRSHGSGAQSEV
jgi:hypothetical protein